MSDRMAQTVVTMVLEDCVEPVFHANSYGYRRGRSALDAVEVRRRRCWESDWVVDFDATEIKSSRDGVTHTGAGLESLIHVAHVDIRQRPGATEE